MVEINPATGAEIANFALPFNAGQAGLALDPLTGNLWYGSDSGTNVVELTRTGTVPRTVNLALQGITQNVIDDLAFDAQGNLYAASSQGQVYRVQVYTIAVGCSTYSLDDWTNSLAASHLQGRARSAEKAAISPSYSGQPCELIIGPNMSRRIAHHQMGSSVYCCRNQILPIACGRNERQKPK